VKEIAKLAGLVVTCAYFTVFTCIRSVGVMGDGRTYDYTGWWFRAVTSIDGMTSEFARIPWDVLLQKNICPVS